MYKVSIFASLRTYFKQFPGIGTVCSTNYNHCIHFSRNLCCFLLPFFGGTANCIPNSSIIPFFRYNFNHILKFVVIKCRLCDNTKLFVFRYIQICRIFFCLNYCRFLWNRPATDSLYLRMIMASRDHDPVSLLTVFLYQLMDTENKRTGCIYNFTAALLHFFIHITGYAVGTDYDRAFFFLFQPIQIMDHMYAFFFQFLYHFFIMDNRTKRIHGSLSLCCHFIYFIYCTFYAKAKSSTFCKHYLHISAKPPFYLHTKFFTPDKHLFH